MQHHWSQRMDAICYSRASIEPGYEVFTGGHGNAAPPQLPAWHTPRRLMNRRAPSCRPRTRGQARSRQRGRVSLVVDEVWVTGPPCGPRNRR
jgi:hypothetical protein